jgi:hypothetical protein
LRLLFESSSRSRLIFSQARVQRDVFYLVIQQPYQSPARMFMMRLEQTEQTPSASLALNCPRTSPPKAQFPLLSYHIIHCCIITSQVYKVLYWSSEHQLATGLRRVSFATSWLPIRPGCVLKWIGTKPAGRLDYSVSTNNASGLHVGLPVVPAHMLWTAHHAPHQHSQRARFLPEPVGCLSWAGGT